MKKLLLSLIFGIFALLSVAQNGSIQGKVLDVNTKEPIPLVTVYITVPGLKETSNKIDDASMKGTITDFDGFYRIENKPGKYTLHLSAVGYQSKEQEVELIAGKITELNFTLEETALQLNDFVYSENKNAQKIEQSTVSISLVKPSLIQNRNATSADLAIEQVPGIAVVESEPQIRGASGFSSGLGSRVLVMIDDIPMLRGDAGRPVWSFLPMENMDQIEVLKGASSVLYGSGASNGVINIRTAFPKNKPEFKFTAFTGIYSGPNDSYKKPWTGFNPTKSGFNFYHSRIFKTKPVDIDFVIGGQGLWDEGYKGGEPKQGPTKDLVFDSTRRNIGEYEHSMRINFNTRFRLKKVEGLAFGLNGNFIAYRESQSFFWQDVDTGIYKMLFGSLTNFDNFMYYIDPYVTYYNKKGDRHSLRMRFFQSYSDGDVISDTLTDKNRLGQDSKSTTVFGEYQYNKSFDHIKAMRWLTKKLSITAGLMGTHTYSKGGVFRGANTPDSTSNATNAAVYAQIEKVFFSRLTIAAGGRWEYFRINDMNDNKPVFRVGANFQLTDGTFIRGSWGQGFRFPSIGERFISTYSAGFGFFSNDSLKPESSWSAEIGVKQLFKIKKWMLGYVDVAGFWQEYENYVEFAYGLWPLGQGFRFFNTGGARIRGVDANVFLQFKPAKNWTIDVMAGYTYSLPQTTQPDYVYGSYKTVDFLTGDTIVKNITYNNTISDTSIRNSRILKYRIQHLVKADLQLGWKKLAVGFTARYYSTMQQIDNFFTSFTGQINPFAGFPEYLDNLGDGAWVFDTRVSYEIKQFRVSFIVDNVFNKEYSVRPLGVASTRLSTLQFTYKM